MIVLMGQQARTHMPSWNKWYPITLLTNILTGNKTISKLQRSVGTLKVCINVLTREKICLLDYFTIQSLLNWSVTHYQLTFEWYSGHGSEMGRDMSFPTMWYSLNIIYCQILYSNGVGSQVLTTLVTTLPLWYVGPEKAQTSLRVCTD